MKDILVKRPLYFHFIFIPFVVAGAVIMMLTNKPDLFRYFNRQHSPIGDLFFFYNTTLGNGAVFVIFCILIFFRNMGEGILSLIIFALSAIVPQIFKKLVFADVVRPTKFFEGDTTIYLVEGVKHHAFHSFPSGHSVSIFALALLATLLAKNRIWGLLFALIAVVTAYSRVYLAQHFFEDIYAGACLGVICVLITFLLFEKKIKLNPKLNKGLLKKRNV